MIVADAVKLLEDEMAAGNVWFRTHERIMLTSEIIEELRKVNQKLTVISFKQNRNLPTPEIHIHIDGRYQKGVL